MTDAANKIVEECVDLMEPHALGRDSARRGVEKVIGYLSKSEMFPPHRHLHLTHNVHKKVGVSVEVFTEQRASVVGRAVTWVSDEQRRKAKETDSVWIMQWDVPDQSVNHYVAASDLDVLMQYAATLG